MQRFLKELSNDTGLVAYGLEEVQKALNIGAVDILILSEKLDIYHVKVNCSNCDYTETYSEREQKLDDLVSSINDKSCPNCNSTSFSIEEKILIIEELGTIAESMGTEVMIISTETEEGEMLYSTFGGIVAILRFKLGY